MKFFPTLVFIVFFFNFSHIVFFFNFSHAQESELYQKLKQKKKYVEGHVIKSNSTRIEGLIKSSDWNAANQFSFISFVHKDGKKEEFYPSELMGFGYEEKEFKADKSSFYKLLVKGERISLYTSALMLPASSAGSFNSGVYVGYSDYSDGLYFSKNESTRFVWIRHKHFQLNFGKYFEDCAELHERIMNGEIIHEHVTEMMEMYDQCDK